MNKIESFFPSNDYVRSVKNVAKKELLIWDNLSDFYVDVRWVCQTTEQYLWELLDKSDEEIYHEYKRIFEERMEYNKEKNKYCSYKYKSMTDYSEKQIKWFYEFYKISWLKKTNIACNF